MTLLGEGSYLVLIDAARTTAREERATVGSDVLLRACANRVAKAVPKLGFALHEARSLIKQPEEPAGPHPGDSIAEGAAALREAGWAAHRYTLPVTSPWSSSEALPWTAAVRACVDGAIEDAHGYGLAYSGVRHLMIRLLSGAPRAIDLAQCAGRNPTAALDALQGDPLTRTVSIPWTPSANRMRYLGISREPRWPLRQLYRTVRWALSRSHVTAPMLLLIEQEANRQCVRLGHDRVDSRHLMLAVAGINEQLRIDESGKRAQVLLHNNSGAILRDVGADYWTILDRAFQMDPPTSRLSDFLPEGRRGPAWTVEAARAVTNAGRESALGPDHLLVAVLAEPSDIVNSLLEMMGATAATIRLQLETSMATQ